MACATVVINANTETPRHHSQILDPPIPRVLSHLSKDLFGIGHCLDGTECGTIRTILAMA
jgi:hypothetical protein